MKYLKYIKQIDPAAKSYLQIILTYPIVRVMFWYRIAHFLYLLKNEVLSGWIMYRVRCKTGIEIHPGAIIGKYFFIDHGMGVVIGETAEIGKNFKIYQGVTIGAKYINNGLKGIKRHPTIKDNVTVYANAVILGGNTIIGNNVIIGCCAVVTKSVDDNKCVVKKEGTCVDDIQ